MKNWLKEKWEWLAGGLFAIIAVILSKKRDSISKVEKNDSKAKTNRDKKVNEGQKVSYEKFISKRSKAEKEFQKDVEEIAERKKSRQKELENNPEELDRILKEKYNLKGE